MLCNKRSKLEAIHEISRWLRPGETVCVYTDSMGPEKRKMRGRDEQQPKRQKERRIQLG
jgi:hypothetical protein